MRRSVEKEEGLDVRSQGQSSKGTPTVTLVTLVTFVVLAFFIIPIGASELSWGI